MASNHWSAIHDLASRGENGRATRRAGGSQLIYSAGWQVIEERNASTGTKQAQYLWSPVYVDAMILRDRDSDGNGTFDQRQYALHDANFNVTALANSSGTLVERFEYDPYGKRAVLDADWTPDGDGTSDVAFAHDHQGLKYDEAAGLYDSRLRPYDPELGGPFAPSSPALTEPGSSASRCWFANANGRRRSSRDRGSLR